MLAFQNLPQETFCCVDWFPNTMPMLRHAAGIAAGVAAGVENALDDIVEASQLEDQNTFATTCSSRYFAKFESTSLIS